MSRSWASRGSVDSNVKRRLAADSACDLVEMKNIRVICFNVLESPGSASSSALDSVLVNTNVSVLLLLVVSAIPCLLHFTLHAAVLSGACVEEGASSSLKLQISNPCSCWLEGPCKCKFIDTLPDLGSEDMCS